MATTPASELLTLVEKWAEVPPGTSPLASRAEEKGWWAPHARAVELTRIVDKEARLLAETQPLLAHALPVLDDVKRLIFCEGRQFDLVTSGHQRLFPESSFAALAALVTALNVSNTATMTPEGAELLAVLSDLESLIADTALDDESRDYLVSLCEHLREAIPRAAEGTTDVRSLAFELFTAVGFYMTPDDGGKLRDVMNRFVKATSKFLLLDVPLAIGSSTVATAILGT